MSILFRCPCGRSMVADSDKAGAIVTCPNCRRRLRVPSGKDRGVEIPASPAATRTLRRCPRCGHDVPIDSQTCPHCQADLRGGPAAGSAPAEAGPSAPATADASLEALKRASARRPAADTRGIVLGGYRGNWFTRLTPGGRAGSSGRSCSSSWRGCSWPWPGRVI